MKVGYVVLYVKDAEACRRFWVEQIGMVEKRRNEVGAFAIVQVGPASRDASVVSLTAASPVLPARPPVPAAPPDAPPPVPVIPPEEVPPLAVTPPLPV